jgi:hypothetical protein
VSLPKFLSPPILPLTINKSLHLHSSNNLFPHEDENTCTVNSSEKPRKWNDSLKLDILNNLNIKTIHDLETQLDNLDKENITQPIFLGFYRRVYFVTSFQFSILFTCNFTVVTKPRLRRNTHVFLLFSCCYCSNEHLFFVIISIYLLLTFFSCYC